MRRKLSMLLLSLMLIMGAGGAGVQIAQAQTTDQAGVSGVSACPNALCARAQSCDPSAIVALLNSMGITNIKPDTTVSATDNGQGIITYASNCGSAVNLGSSTTTTGVSSCGSNAQGKTCDPASIAAWLNSLGITGLKSAAPVSTTDTTKGTAATDTNSGSTANTGSTSSSATAGNNAGSTVTAASAQTSSTTASAPGGLNVSQNLPNMAEYNQQEKPIVDAFRASFDHSLAQTIVGRAIWYMEYGYMAYGHTSYATTGYIDCSQFVSRVYKDFGYSITSASRKYNTVGTVVSGVYAKRLPNSSKYTLVGVENLKPGDIFTFWATDSSGNRYISHVALYMGVINGKPCIINTVTGRPTAIGIVNNFSYWYGSNLFQVRRVLNAQAYVPNNQNIKDNGPVIPAVYQIKPQAPIVMPKDLPAGF